MGWVWEGATAPLPIGRAVSEANSFLGGWGAETRGCRTAADGVSRARANRRYYLEYLSARI